MTHYNLLHYNNYTSYCTAGNNNLETKNNSLRTILVYNQPDIFTVNEMHCSAATADMLLDIVDEELPEVYERAEMSCTSYISNMLFYNSDKFGMAAQDVVYTNVREIDIYKLYYKPEGISIIEDTVFLHCIVAHLKSGNTATNAAERTDEVQRLLVRLEENYTQGNFVFAGDYNVYSSSEEAFKHLIDPESSFRFYDPVNMIGSWHNNEYFAPVHTQSTHTSGGCASSGGMDDRFDFILATEEVMEGSEGIKYVPGSYKAIGQDGEHFNKSLLDLPENTSVPADVLQALYNMSDHLPVSMKIVAGNELGTNELPDLITHLKIKNPVDDIIEIKLKSSNEQEVIIRLLDLSGREIIRKQQSIQPGQNNFTIGQEKLSPGMYLLNFDFSSGGMVTRKVVKK